MNIYKRVFVLLLIALCSFLKLSAQQMKEALPEFAVQVVGKDKIRISWVNPYGEDCIQINVQRSYDSLRSYKTVFSTPSPELPENGFIDNYYDGVKVYYRIFYMLSSNAYFFTKTKRAGLGFIDESLASQLNDADTVTIMTADTILARFPYSHFLKFKDSIYINTKDSLLSVGNNTILLKPYIYNGAWRASAYLFTDRAGIINLKLPMAKEKRYSLHVYEGDTRSQIFFIRRITETELMIDKTNFLHAGWFTFELYEDDKLKERNKLYVQKEF